ncbi:MAG: ABC transporter ATP-binding protein [Oscillospiraceae bacterium]|jgi:putative ABC transport system ATP-binding protein
MILELKDICKTYYDEGLEVPVLHDITFDVAEGEFVSIMGPSGSGKSTLLNIIGCLDLPTSGTYLLDGSNVGEKNDNELAEIRNRCIGFVFQSFNLLPHETALENVELPLLYAGVPAKEREERARKSLESVGLSDRVNFLPTQLSGGQRQRVAVARAMINSPRLLLADEPTGALDSKSGTQLMELFTELNRDGMTIVMITHELRVAKYAGRILVLKDGRLSPSE